MYRKSKDDQSQYGEFRAGRASSEALLGPVRKLLMLFLLMVAISVPATLFIERYGMPGLRWEYQYTKSGNTKCILRAEYLTPWGLVDQGVGREFGVVEFFPVPEDRKFSRLLKSWLSP